MADYDVIVIGAGLGGLTVGALLAKQGRRVLILEQSERVGGCCSSFEREGYHFDLGASIIELIAPIEKAFQMLGTSLQKEVDLMPVDPIATLVYKDGSHITYPQADEEMIRVLAGFSPEAARNWPRFAAYYRELTEVCMNTLFTMPADTLGDLARWVIKDPRLLKFLPKLMVPYQDMVHKFFQDPKVEHALAYQSLYFGLPPELCPGLFSLVAYTEHLGSWYPRGGMIQLPLALQRCGERLGMQVRLNTRVQRVLVRNRRAEGVRLSDGTEITSKLVVSNINAKTLYQDMVGEENLPPLARAGVRSYQVSTGMPMVYLGLDYRPPLASHHSQVAVSMEGMNRYWHDKWEQGKLPDEQFGLLCWPTHSDPSLAPEGHHVLCAIPQGPYHLQGEGWDAIKPRFVEGLIDQLDKTCVPGLAAHVRVADCATPLDFERRLLLPKGAIYGLVQDVGTLACFRPAARSKSIKGLYLAGSSTAPGGGVPTVISSGIITSGLIAKHETA